MKVLIEVDAEVVPLVSKLLQDNTIPGQLRDSRCCSFEQQELRVRVVREWECSCGLVEPEHP